MSLRCPNCIEMHIGINAAAVCDRVLAKRSGFDCPRQRNRYDRIQASCFDISSLIRKDRKSITKDEAREMLYPDRSAISGDGQPDAAKDAKKDPIGAKLGDLLS